MFLILTVLSSKNNIIKINIQSVKFSLWNISIPITSMLFS